MSKKKISKMKAKKLNKNRQISQPPTPQFFIIETNSKDDVARAQGIHGPFESLELAEKWIANTSAIDWMESCGCLRSGDPKTWGCMYLIVQSIRRVRPVPPDTVQMTLIDVLDYE